MGTVKLKVEGEVANIILNRPEVGNAFNRDMLLELRDICENISKSENIRVVIISGEGKHFCAGGDLNWMREMGKSEYHINYEDAQLLYDTYLSLENLPVPLIAKVKGAVRGGGMGIVSVSDIVISSNKANFSFSEVKLGLVPSVVSSFALLRLSYSIAKRLFLTGEVFDAEFARRINFVDEVVEEDELDKKVEEFVNIILSNKPEAVRKTKKLMKIYRSFQESVYKDITSHILATTRMSKEALDGIEEFLQGKRK